ncbi:beta-lactamase family protein [Ensifer adhaerens]|uniref:serine hydrolase domain-containing protein n=1 Tax=Ensifer adhaerens TaxID=106592 RepID=UPI001CBD3693|nr:serine hydrolase domain-containing protein [Ensifer adhaerens]MBZ7925082.1 beta-lactamase family protein [Ensifer adhaerens]UAX95728.1 beta-lactamase family protein [Ensifer adhaerens]UAY04931.1 beta-lactamase family protein [Ensifer adhaerens]UAY10363.1 beta-lactamase family protein [Ensifer adhaerens]
MDTSAIRQWKSEGRNRLKAELDPVIAGALDERRILGTVVEILVHGEPAYRCAAGFADREAGRPMTRDGIFLLSSVTKPIVTVAALTLVQSGRVGLDDAVSDWLPAFRPRLPDGSAPRITIRQLLTHSAGLSYVFMEQGDGPYHQHAISSGLDDTDDDFPTLLDKLSDIPLSYPPGKGWGYSMGLDVLGAVIEQVTGSTLPEAVTALVTGPLAMIDTAYAVTDTGRLVTHYGDGSPQPRRLASDDAVPFFGNPVRFSPGRIFNPRAFPSSGAGMAGTSGDVIRLLESLRTAHSPVLDDASARSMFDIQARTGGLASGPGWEFGFGGAVLVEPKIAGTPQSRGTLQWDGAYGHKWFVDPARGLTVIALTNTAFEGMNGRFPVDLRDAIYRSL